MPGKNLRKLAGKPLIAHTIECARKARSLHRVVVSTDDPETAEVARRWGAEVPFTRPAHLATDTASKWHVFQHLVDTLEQMDNEPIDVLVDLDIGAPLRHPADIDAAVALLQKGEVDVVVTAYEADRNPYFNMIQVSVDGYARLVNEQDKPVTCRQQAPRVFSLSPAVYAIRRGILNEVDHWSRARMKILEIPRARAIDIDSTLDFELVEYLMTRKQRQDD